jgi:porin
MSTVPDVVLAQSASDLISPNSTEKILAFNARKKDSVLDVDNLETWRERRARFAEKTGFTFGMDYNVLGFAASSSLSEKTSAGGVFRFMGTWDLMDRGGPNAGTLVFKFESRHGLTDVAPAAFGMAELGYVGGVTGAFSNEGGPRVTNFYWQQKFANERGIAFVGWLDTTDYVDVYALPSPWTGFSNRAFQTGSGTIAGLNDGTLGAMVSGFVNENVYLAAGIVDANGVATDPFNGFDTLFNTGETFKTFEIGYTSGVDKLNYDVVLNNTHLTFWQIDALESAGTKEGHGVAFSHSRVIGGAWLPFLRGGWADGGNSAYEAAVSVGFGYSHPSNNNLLAAGINWSKPNQDIYGPDLKDQLTLEIFQRWQLTENIEVTPSIQVLQNPALNPDKDTIALLGLRVRVSF